MGVPEPRGRVLPCQAGAVVRLPCHPEMSGAWDGGNRGAVPAARSGWRGPTRPMAWPDQRPRCLRSARYSSSLRIQTVMIMPIVSVT